jgi:hypothetical protein
LDVISVSYVALLAIRAVGWRSRWGSSVLAMNDVSMMSVPLAPPPEPGWAVLAVPPPEDGVELPPPHPDQRECRGERGDRRGSRRRA